MGSSGWSLMAFVGDDRCGWFRLWFDIFGLYGRGLHRVQREFLKLFLKHQSKLFIDFRLVLINYINRRYPASLN